MTDINFAQKTRKQVPHTAVERVAVGYCFRSAFQLFEQLAEASRDWEMDFCQLRPANSPFTLEQLSTPRMRYGRAALDSHFHQRGGPTVHFRSFALHTEFCSDYRWCGEVADRHSLVVMPIDGEFESVSGPGFDIFTLSLPVALLERTAEMEFQRPLAEFLGPGGEIRYGVGSALSKLRASLHSLSSSVGRGGDHFATLYGVAGVNRLEHMLSYLILACLESGHAQRPRGPRNKRMLALGRAREAIRQTAAQQLSMADLVAQSGVSRRTLEYAFLDGLGVSPALYLKALRLRALNKQLLACEPQHTSVADLSGHHGFSHLGQLAADYRELFGELPSATLRRDAARAQAPG